MRNANLLQSWVYTLLLVLVTAVWGWTFVVVQDAIAAYAVLGFLALRFALASLALAPLFPRLTLRTLLVGSGIGLVLGMGYLFQTVGLLYTTPTNSGLIRSEEHTSELQSRQYLVCRLLLEKKKH